MNGVLYAHMTIEKLSASHQEIELKFRVIIDALPEGILDTVEKHKITQAYTAINEDGSETRVRKDHNVTAGETVYTRTSKSAGGVARTEIEEIITEDGYNKEAQNIIQGSRPVEKTRYRIPYVCNGKAYTVELDVYEGTLSNLVVAEIEFDTQEEANEFVKPDWLGEDVSADKAYKNKNLARKGIPEGYITDVALSGMTKVVGKSRR